MEDNFQDSAQLYDRSLDDQDPSGTGPGTLQTDSSGETDNGDALGSDPLPEGSGFSSPSGARTVTG